MNGCCTFVNLQVYQLLAELKKRDATIAKLTAEVAEGAPRKKVKPNSVHLKDALEDETGELVAEVSFNIKIHYCEFLLHNSD